MSSTEETRIQEALDEFFDEVLAPMSARMKALGQEAFPLGPDAALESYYAPRPQPSMTREDFTAPSCRDANDFEPRLAAHWRALGRSELLGEIPRIAVLARTAQESSTLHPKNPELPPQTYVMF